MAAKDRLPLFLSDQAEDARQPDTGTIWNRAVISTRILKASVLGTTAAAIVFAIVAVENPLLFLANAEFVANTKAFLDSVSRPQTGTREATPVTQSAAVAQAFPPVAGGAPTGGEIAAPFKTADRSQTETRQPPTENLLGQFQAWAAGEAAPVEVPPAQPLQDAQPQPVRDTQPQPQPVQDAQANSRQDARANPVQDARAQIRPVPKHRPVKHVRNARSEIRLNQNLRAKLRREQNARVQLRPAQDARAQDIRAQDARAQEPAVQNVRTPTFLESLGFRDIGSRE